MLKQYRMSRDRMSPASYSPNSCAMPIEALIELDIPPFRECYFTKPDAARWWVPMITSRAGPDLSQLVPQIILLLHSILTRSSYTQLLRTALTHSSYRQQPLLPDGFKRNQGELRVSVYKVSGDQRERPLGSLRLKRIAATQESARYLADENP